MNIAMVIRVLVIGFVISFANTNASAESFRTSDGVRLHYSDTGRGDPMVLVPGFTMPGWMWRYQIDHWSKNRRVIVLDPRGQGQSFAGTAVQNNGRRAQDVRELIGHLRLTDVTLVGWSLAVSEVIRAAATAPALQFKALILVDGSVTAANEQEIKYALPVVEALKTQRPKFTEQFVDSMFCNPIAPADRQKLVSQSQSLLTDSAVTLISEYAFNDSRPLLTSIKVPILFLYQKAMTRQAEALVASVPTAKTATEANWCHAMFFERPDAFNRVVDEFLAEVRVL